MTTPPPKQMTKPKSKHPNWQGQRQKPKTAAQQASEANQRQQMAIKHNTARPGDRQAPDADPKPE